MNTEELHPINPKNESENIPLTNQIIPLVPQKKETSFFTKAIIIIASIMSLIIIITACILFFKEKNKSGIENQDYRLAIYIKKEFLLTLFE